MTDEDIVIEVTKPEEENETLEIEEYPDEEKLETDLEEADIEILTEPDDSVEEERQSKENQKKKGFKVTDRRFWRKDKNKDGSGDDDEVVDNEDYSPKKPTYVEQLEKKLEEKDVLLQKYISAYKDAEKEFEKSRNRLRKSMSEEVDREKGKLFSALLEIIDNFELSLKVEVNENSYQAFVQGVDMIYQQLIGKLAQLGAERFDGNGENFDPNFFEGLMVEKVDSQDNDNKIMEVFRCGFKYKDKVIRPAQVKVGKFQG